MKILIVDDDLTNQKILVKQLEKLGTCDLAKDGNEALEAFDKAIASDAPYTLILLDILMPHIDGQQVLEAIRARESAAKRRSGSPVRVIMTTSLKDSKVVLGAFRNGCEGYIVKPVDPPELWRALSKIGIQRPE